VVHFSTAFKSIAEVAAPAERTTIQACSFLRHPLWRVLRRTQPSKTCELHGPQLLWSLSLCFEALQIADECTPAIDPHYSLRLQPAEIAGDEFADGSDL